MNDATATLVERLNELEDSKRRNTESLAALNAEIRDTLNAQDQLKQKIFDVRSALKQAGLNPDHLPMMPTPPAPPSAECDAECAKVYTGPVPTAQSVPGTVHNTGSLRPRGFA